MSNSRRLPRARTGPHCAACGHRIGALAARVDLPDGRSVCGSCRDAGVLSRRLPCGHLGVPGMTVIADSADLGNFQCPRCSPHAAALAAGRGGYAGQ
jgi:hypothetical protein